jgi:hypothetical protein
VVSIALQAVVSWTSSSLISSSRVSMKEDRISRTRRDGLRLSAARQNAFHRSDYSRCSWCSKLGSS